MKDKIPAPNSNIAAYNKTKANLAEDELILSEEPFYTIQGEGQYSGKAAFFVRTAFCSLTCNFCDSVGIWDVKRIKYTFEGIYKKLQNLNQECKLIIFTGGEPALQISKGFVKYFQNLGYQINIETSGSVYNEALHFLDYICLSPKRLSDQSGHKNILNDRYIVNKDAVQIAGEIKFIIDVDTDEQMILNFIKEHSLERKIKDKELIVYLSPMDLYDEEANKANRIKLINLVQKYPNLFSISLQIHKILGVE